MLEKEAASIAILMTCHNRRDITLTCLQNLYRQDISFKVYVYLVDDGSSDGTSDAIRLAYPNVNVLSGDGSLFWVGGMRLAFAEAMKTQYDYYLWLNDDTLLEPHALTHLLSVHRSLASRGHIDAIVVGSTKDCHTGKPTYGGAKRTTSWYSNKYEFVEPSSEIQACDTMFGNCVLIPHRVAEKVGNLDPAFIHSLGDLDYGLRARRMGCSIWVAPGYVATCSRNTIAGSWVDTNLSIWQRLKKATQVKGFPLRPWTTFTRRHSGPFWFLYWCLPYIRAVVGYRNLEASPTFCADATQKSSSLD